MRNSPELSVAKRAKLSDSTISIPTKLENIHKMFKCKFPGILFDALDAAVAENYSDVISWWHNGKAFKIHKHHVFFDKMIGKWFRSKKKKQFEAQLREYGFNRYSIRLQDKNCYCHPNFLKGERQLCATMKLLKYSKKEPD